MLKIKECIEVLNRCIPKFFRYNEWRLDRTPTVLSVYLDGILVSIDKLEVDGKTDDEVKKLIKNRIIGVLKDVIAEIDSNE